MQDLVHFHCWRWSWANRRSHVSGQWANAWRAVRPLYAGRSMSVPASSRRVRQFKALVEPKASSTPAQLEEGCHAVSVQRVGVRPRPQQGFHARQGLPLHRHMQRGVGDIALADLGFVALAPKWSNASTMSQASFRPRARIPSGVLPCSST